MRYTVYVESMERIPSGLSSQPFSTWKEQSLDSALCEVNPAYAALRKQGALKPAQLLRVPRGTFDKIRNEMIRDGRVSATQFKMPRVARSPHIVDTLEATALRN
mmetsp:Transcript_46267/g.72445  ORF Transcript_46267/g.72445 Transcript_46267/m.72445 type:complete len:104 (-) Transcript_46267:752-1063(-)